MQNKKNYLTLLAVIALFQVAAFSATVTKQTDVLVIGGTTGGVSAGIQSARLGVPTLIVEETPWLGGMLTAGGVSATDGNHNMPAGIWNEYRERLRDYYGGAQYLTTGWVSNTQYEPHVGAAIFQQMAQAESNLQVMHGYYLVSVTKEGNRVTGAFFKNDQNDSLKVTAKVVVDATDLGDGLKMAGATYRLGMDARSETGEAIAPEQANDIVQDLTWVAILKKNISAAPAIACPPDYDRTIYLGSCNPNCDQMLSYGGLPNKKMMINWPRHGNDIYLNVVEMTREERIVELQKAKNRTLGFAYYIQNEIDATIGLATDEYTTADKLAYVPYHREGRRLKGVVTLTFNHVQKPYEQTQPLYRTGISVGDYPVDHHHGCNPAAPVLNFEPVPSFNIPLGALIPESVDGLIVADKAISITNLINGSTRLQPCVLLTGQAAGTLAAFSARDNKAPREVNIRELQQKLLDVYAYIMPLYDVKPADVNFKAIQRIAATGILKTTGEPYGWANRTWFYPENIARMPELTSGLHAYDPSFAVQTEDVCVTLGRLKTLFATQLPEANWQTIWQNISSRSYSETVCMTRRELTLFLDKYINPFAKKIDFQGNFVQGSTSLEEVKMESSYILYQQSGRLTVKGDDTPRLLEIYTITGEKMGSISDSNEISLPGIKGVYLVRVCSGSGKTEVHKIVLN